MCEKIKLHTELLKQRIVWIDIVKFLGIFLIYLGHFGNFAGRAYPFVFAHHVPLFFFISGCTENYNKDTSIYGYVIGKIKSLLIPFWCFAVGSIILETLIKESSFIDVAKMFVQMAKGAIRNDFVSGSLWFITCLFVMQVFFYIIKSAVKKSGVILGCCIALSYFAQYGLGLYPASGPRWLYNIDSAMHYIVYYAIGYVLFPYVVRLFEMDTEKKKWVFIITGLISFVYTALMFFGKDLFEEFYYWPRLAFFVKIVSVLIMIWFWFVVAKALEGSHWSAMVGRNTLYLCGAEFFVRHLCDQATSLFNVSIQFNTPFAAYVYAGIMLYLANRYLVPIEKFILSKINGIFGE